MQSFTNELIDLNELPKYEEIILENPHPNYWKVIVINISIFFLIVAIALALFILFNKDFKAYSLAIGIGYLLLVIGTFLLYSASFKKRGYALREKDVVYKSGIIAETTTIIPLNRIQHVALDEGLFARFYSLATLEVQTAGGSAGNIRIAGIPIEKAKIIKEALVKRLDLLENATPSQ